MLGEIKEGRTKKNQEKKNQFLQQQQKLPDSQNIKRMSIFFQDKQTRHKYNWEVIQTEFKVNKPTYAGSTVYIRNLLNQK